MTVAFDISAFDDIAFDVGSVVVPTSSVAPIDHVAAGLARLYMQFRKPNIIALLRNNLERWNDLEQVCQDLLVKRSIFVAEDSQLDDIGRIVVQPRNGLDDEVYRRYLFARIAVNNSNGLVEDVIKVTRLILNDDAARVVVEQWGIAAMTVRIADVGITDDLAAVLIDLLLEVPLGGARITLEWSTVAPEDVFTFDGGPGFDDGFLAGSAG